MEAAGTSITFPPKFTTQGNSSRVEEMLRKQKSNFKALSRTLDAIDLDSISERWEFEDHLKSIQSRWSVVDSLHWDIDSEGLLDNEDYELAYAEMENKYNTIKRAINSRMYSASYREHSTPKMDIPSFSGNYQDWISFKDLFSEAIHNNKSLPKAQKMQFLKSKLRGEAERLIHHLRISSENYETCWEILNHRYNNMRLIFNSHINLLLTMPTINQQSAAVIKRLHDTTNECLNSIKAMGIDISNWDPLIVYILAQKLDSQTHHDYIESLKNPRALPTIAEFINFLEIKFTSLESSRRKQDSSKPMPSSSNMQYNYYQKPWNKSPHNNHNNFINRNFQQKPVVNNVIAKPASIQKCLLCKQYPHALYQCKMFLESSPHNRLKIIERNNLCKNCLVNHLERQCTSEKTCRFCNDKHNTLLHNAYITSSPSSIKQNEKSTRISNTCVTNLPLEPTSKLLATALINIKGVDGCHQTMRALIDPCAESSLITENAAQILGLPRIKRNCVVVGVGAKANNSRGVIQLSISSLYSNFTFKTEAYVMKHIVGSLPSESFEKPSWPHLQKLSLADPEFYKSKPIDLILSVDVYELIILPGVIRNNISQPIAQNTKLGWILSGTVSTPVQSRCNVVMINLKDIQRFWEIEDVSDNSINMSDDDYQCIQQYQLHTKRQPDGRYVVRLPLKPEVTEKLGESKTKAIAQFRQLEKRFTKNKIIEQNYKEFINEYINLKHMSECKGNPTLECYLPHHCVLRAESMTTSTRVVFNASAKTSTGYSLNDLMYSGPNLQGDLLSIIMRWRQYKIAFTADIEKMFRQILIHQDDQELQKIIWRDSENQPLREYQLATVTYGTKAAPFLAMMTLKQLAKDEAHRFPEAAEVLTNSFYMDDLLYGEHDLESAYRLIADLINLLKLGGFNLRKWSSNIPEILQNLSSTDKDQAYVFKHQESTKALGLKWHPNEDHFTFQLKTEPSIKLTKRALLSNISKIFDPLGWLSPVTTKLKLIFQQIWLLDLQWDDILPDNIINKWRTIEKDITKINNITIPRWLQCYKTDTIELHGFCDSSENAYACVIYCRIKNSCQNQPTVVIVAAKSRLVPIKKKVSLPRLELCAAVLLAKVMKITCQCLSNYQIKIYGWSDSTAVLGWLNGDPSRWKPFVSNRVKQVTDSIPSSCWHYVSTKDNPADCASRGITPEQLVNHRMWWSGPTWLLKFDETKITTDNNYTTTEELKKSIQINISTLQYNNEVVDAILCRYSDIARATRVLAWILRITLRSKNKPQYLTILEIRKAKNILIKHVQQLEFSEDIEYIKKYNQPNPKSNLLKLRPFIDEQGILRVGGRITNANVQDHMKHPCILPRNHHLTDMIIDQAHKFTFHGGARLTLAWLRQEYWILSGNSTVKKRLRQCVLCRKYDPVKQNQLMGDLPAARTNMTRPFYHTGVDFTGFVDVKSAKGRGVKCTKGYIAVFVCMATKAIHLELVSDLTASAFIAALRRLSARRGAPGHIYSDNGTNFIKANRILQEEIVNLKSILDEQFYSELLDMQIEWHFNAPSWPSAGGLWEAAVKSLKYHLKRVIGEQKLTYEEFSTLLAQLESCLNSRPLCPLSEDPDDLNFLTPAHFLSGGPTLTIVESETDLRTRWQLTQKIFQDIWKRWRTEYLTQLNARSKWQRLQPNLNIGDIVVIHDANLPPGKWALGRVVELHPGQDGLVRVVSIKTKTGIMKRPIIKLSILPVNHNTKTTEYNQNTNHAVSDPKPRVKRGNKKGIYHFITMALMMFTIFFTPISCAHNILNFNNSQSLYFDKLSTIHLARDEWKLVVYYDLEPYWQGNKLLLKYLDHLQDICDQGIAKNYCEPILIQLRHGYTELLHYNNILSRQQFPHGHARRRRGLINVVGNVAHSLFGVLDDQFAEQYSKDIELIRNNQNHLATLWKNQTSIVEAEYNVLKRMKDSIDKQHKMFNRYLNQLKNQTTILNNQVKDVERTNEFLLSSVAANSLELNLKNIQDVLLDTVSEVYYGKFNIHLLRPDQLLQELNIISGKLSKDLSLPIGITSSELPKIYHLLKVKAKLYKGFFIFEITIPLVSKDNYEVYRMISIPKKIDNTMVTLVPVSDYVAINLQKDSFITLSQVDLQQCVPFDSDSTLCPLQKPIFHMKHDDRLCLKNHETQPCKTKTAECQDSWTRLNDINSYFFFCCDLCYIRIICEDIISSEKLSNAGIIKLSSNCVVKGRDITIHTQKHQTNNLTIQADIPTINIPPINQIFYQNDNMSVPPMTEPVSIMSGHEKDLNDIGSSIKQMGSEAGLRTAISYHDVHHYVVIYLVAGAVGAAAAVYGLRRWRGRRTAGDAGGPPAAAASADAGGRPAADCAACGGGATMSARLALRGLTNAAYHYSVSDQCVSVSDQCASVSDQCVNVSDQCASVSDKCGEKDKCCEHRDKSTSPIIQKHSFGDHCK